MIIADKTYDKNRTYIMGILNVTPDSFYDGDRYSSLDRALKRALTIVEEGGDIIDIGGESTRPGSAYVSEQEELERVMPVIEAIRREVDVPLSLDTYKANVAAEGIKAGIDLINDIWGLKYDDNMARVISEGGVACCLMHNRNDRAYNDLVKDVYDELNECIDIALKAKIDKDRIMIDPGIGFGKDTDQNLEVLKHIDIYKDSPYPVLLGVSRKSVIGNVLNVETKDRLSGTLALASWGILNHVSWLRVHDVKEHVHTVKMLEYMIR